MGAGIGVFIFLLLLALGAVIVVVVAVRRKVTHKQKGDSKMKSNPYYNNELMAKQGNEMKKNGLAIGAGHDYDYVEKNILPVDSFHPYEGVDSKTQINSAMKLAPNVSSTPVSVTRDLYAVVDKSQKKGAEKEKETVTNKEDLYTMSMKKKGKLTERGEGVVESGDVEKGEEFDDMAGVMYEPKADSESVQQTEENSKALNVDMLYAVVDKSHKKKK